jgi:hypothetical protein
MNRIQKHKEIKNMRYLKYILMALLMASTFYGRAIAADIYNDSYWKTDANGVRQLVNNTYGGEITPYAIINASNSPYNITATQSGRTFIASQASVLTYTTMQANLPVSAAGLEYSFSTTGIATLSVNPRDTESIKATITGLSGGDMITSPAATGSSVTLIGLGNGLWAVKEQYGTWTDGN